jgi:cellulose synthase/poly-beta-1,6-N-acetylglucosamine synthase-like glycosyltransferase
VNDRRWFNASQPQTLQMAVILLYIDAVFLLIGGALGFLIFFVIMVAMAAGGFGIANDKKWGYALGLAGAVLYLVWPLFYGANLSYYLGRNILNTIFGVALVALLLHPMSRDYQRIWFH